MRRLNPSRSERGTVLIIVPTMALVLLALGAIAVDMSALHAQHRHLHSATSAAADDAAGMIDGAHLQLTGATRIDPVAARRVALAHLVDDALPGRLEHPPVVQVASDGRSLEIRASVRVRRLLLPSLRPGAAEERLSARVVAGIEP